MSPPTQVCERFYEGGEEIVEIPLLTVTVRVRPRPPASTLSTVEVIGITDRMVRELEMEILAASLSLRIKSAPITMFTGHCGQ